MAEDKGSTNTTHQTSSEHTPREAPTTTTDLSTLPPADLIARINDLESRLRTTTAQLAALTSANTTTTTPTPINPSSKISKFKKQPKPFDFSRYSTRHIALKFAYLGHRYNGYEHTNGGAPPLKPTIEEALWKALRKARLIDPAVPDGCDGTFEVVFDEAARRKMYWENGTKLELDWVGMGLGYSKCGRTDKGVSAFGQVVGVRLRSNRPKGRDQELGCGVGEDGFDGVKDELPYISLLNSVLPSDIRILAWCPDPGPAFDARFSCRERRYKYFFTNPAFCPTPGVVGLRHANGEEAPVREGWLDVDAMREAARKLEGLHDFRNFCKLDASKQMSSCERRITFADIQEMPGGVGLNTFMTDSNLNAQSTAATTMNGVSGSDANEHPTPTDLHGPKVYTFAVHGTAFLWHQVRCMVAVLFLVGQGLEKPELVDELLDITRNPGKPQYELADDAPLVLWDCVFSGDEHTDEAGMKWIYAGDEAGTSDQVKKSDSKYDAKFGVGGLVSDLWVEWREAKMKETLTAGLLGLALTQGDGTSLHRGGFRPAVDLKTRSQRVFAGADSGRTVGEYIPVMQKPKSETLEVQNAKYLAGKQARRDLKKAQGLEEEEEVVIR